MSGFRFTVRVRPGASRTAVGGRYGQDTLVVAVMPRAVDGAANRAVVSAVADAFCVRRAEVAIASGERSRTKQLEVVGDVATLADRHAELLDRSGS